jgi:hypothetical protein
MASAINSTASPQPDKPAEDSHLAALVTHFNDGTTIEKAKRKIVRWKFSSNDELLTPEEVAAFVRIPYHSNRGSRTEFWDWVHREGVPYITISKRRILFDRLDILIWLQRRKTGGRDLLSDRQSCLT